jgi:PAS domain S-box-containing protein
VINRPLEEALPEITSQGLIKILTDVYTTGIPFIANEFQVELKRFGKPETVFLNFIYEPIKNEVNEITGIIAMGFDVTEQVIARKKIEQSEKELNELANAVPQLVWVAAPNGDVIYYNDRVSEFAGATKNRDNTWSWAGLLHPDDIQATEDAWKHALATGTNYQIEHRVKEKNGNYRWYLSRGFPHKDENGNVIKWFGSATDIHSSKEHASILEEEVKKRTHELNVLNQTLQDSNNELQQFAHVASHDLKEPLRKIKTFMGRLIDDPETTISNKASVFLNKINGSVDRMNMMIEGVLNYSIVSASNEKMEQVDLNVLIENIESDLDLLISQKSAKLEYDRLPVIEGAQVLLYQMFYNLINNSLKFSNANVPQVITITCSTIKKGKKEFYEIRVRDRGIGFMQEYAENIFDTFTRLNSKDKYEGTGLGLSLCKRIAERHGGSIRATGQPNKGAEFIIELPKRIASSAK